MGQAAKHFLKRGKTDEYGTPAFIVQMLGKFQLDPCASSYAKHARVNWTKEQNGLNRKWIGRVFMNPPYSHPLVAQFTERFILHGNGIALVLARTGTKWFQKMLVRADAVFFMQGRINFLRNGKQTKNSAMSSVFIAIGKQNVAVLQKLKLKGVLLYGNRCNQR